MVRSVVGPAFRRRPVIVWSPVRGVLIDGPKNGEEIEVSEPPPDRYESYDAATGDTDIYGLSNYDANPAAPEPRARYTHRGRKV